MKLRHVSIFKPKRRNKRHHAWLIAYGTGKDRKVITGPVDYDDAVELAQRLSRKSQRVRIGLDSREELRCEAQRIRPLTKHLDEYERHLIASGKTRRHALQMRLCAEQSLEAFAVVDSIDAHGVQARIASMKIGASGKNRRIYAVGHFLRWGCDDLRWPRSVSERVRLTRYAAERSKRRRILSLPELARLVSTARNGIAIAGTSGKERALIYGTMLATGVRLGELSRLTCAHLCGNAIEVPAALTKNRKPARLSLPQPLADQIHRHVEGKPDEAKIFRIPSNPDRLLKHDLGIAGILRSTREGVFDFHSLRHQSGMILISAGVQPKAVQSHMRHGSIKLTLDTYGHVMDSDRRQMASLMGELVQRLDNQTGANLHEQNPQIVGVSGGLQRGTDGCDSAVIPLDHGPKDETERLILQIFGIETSAPQLRDRRGRRLAPGAAPRLLRKVFSRTVDAARRRGAGR